MAIIAVIFGSLLGFLAGVVQVAILGGTFWQAFVTYVTASFALSAFIGAWGLLMAHLSRATKDGQVCRSGNSRTWQDWQAEEETESDGGRSGVGTTVARAPVPSRSA